MGIKEIFDDERFFNKYLELRDDKNNYNDAVMQHVFSNVTCAIKIPGVSNVTIDAPTSKNDVKPTLAQICGFEDVYAIAVLI